MPVYTYPLLYSISIFIGIYNYKKFSHNKYLKLFLAFLIYTFISEIIGNYLGLVLKIRNNIVYNTWNILCFLFYAYFFLSRIKNKKRRNSIKVLVAFFSVFTLINILFFGNIIEIPLIYNLVLAKFLVALIIIIYFAELLGSDEILSIQKSLFFWISLGAFLYNISFLPAIALYRFTSISGYWNYIILSLNIILLSCFIIGFIISEKEYNS